MAGNLAQIGEAVIQLLKKEGVLSKAAFDMLENIKSRVTPTDEDIVISIFQTEEIFDGRDFSILDVVLSIMGQIGGEKSLSAIEEAASRFDGIKNPRCACGFIDGKSEIIKDAQTASGKIRSRLGIQD